ncbi:hypothetical protein [Acidovorax sp.]|uniref:hypothetical protein n=1 Tax=Acidovorax sp. TaxID=1872122 RepID=UPI00391F7D93
MNAKANSKTATPAAPAKPVSFFDSLTAIAKPVAKLSSLQAQQDPKLALRTRFVASVGEQIKLVQAAAPKSRWFVRNPDGSYVLTLRNSNSAMPVQGTTYFAVPDAEKAVAFLTAVQEGTKAGEMDEVLAATTRKPRARKEPAPTPAPASK